jgi:hypothetical protein
MHSTFSPFLVLCAVPTSSVSFEDHQLTKLAHQLNTLSKFSTPALVCFRVTQVVISSLTRQLNKSSSHVQTCRANTTFLLLPLRHQDLLLQIMASSSILSTDMRSNLHAAVVLLETAEVAIKADVVIFIHLHLINMQTATMAHNMVNKARHSRVLLKTQVHKLNMIRTTLRHI